MTTKLTAGRSCKGQFVFLFAEQFQVHYYGPGNVGSSA